MDNFNNQQQFQQQFQQQTVPNAPDFIILLILSIASTLCCCLPAGTVSLVFTLMANSDFKSGNIAGYTSKVKTAKVMMVIGVILTLLCSCIYGVLFALGISE